MEIDVFAPVDARPPRRRTYAAASSPASDRAGPARPTVRHTGAPLWSGPPGAWRNAVYLAFVYRNWTSPALWRDVLWRHCYTMHVVHQIYCCHRICPTVLFYRLHCCHACTRSPYHTLLLLSFVISLTSYIRSLHWLIITECKLLSVTYTKFSQLPNLHTFITSSLFNVLAVLARSTSLYKTLVGPRVECCSSAWNPHYMVAQTIFSMP